MENAKLNTGENITENTQPAEPEKAVENAKLVEPEEAVENAKPAEPAEPAEVAEKSNPVEAENASGNEEDDKAAAGKAQAKKPAAPTRSRSAAALTTQEKIEQIRATEQAKLEALKEREREKTRLAIEKERERLERELRAEIRQLEAQLQLSRSAFEEESIADVPVTEVKPVTKPKPKPKATKKAKEVAAAPAEEKKEAEAKPKKTRKVKTDKPKEPAKDVKAQEPVEVVEVKEPVIVAKDEPAAEEKVKVVAKAEDKEIVAAKEDKPVAKPEPDETPISNLQKLKEQIMAQKLLEKELMEKEAKKAQEQDKTISERIASLGMLTAEEGEQLISVDEFEEQRKVIEGLKAEKTELQDKINNLHDKLDKLFRLQLDGMNLVDDAEDCRLSSLFVENYEKRKQQLEIMEKKITDLEKIVSDNARQIDEAEQAFLRLQETHQLQARRLAELSEQIDNVGGRRPAFGYADAPIAPRDYSAGYRSSEIVSIYRELDGLQREINRLATSMEYGQRYGGFKDKEREIESLRLELEKRMGQGQSQYCPYYASPQHAAPANPVGNEPAANKDDRTAEELIDEINKLKEEIAALKEQQKQSHDDSIAIMKEVQNELSRTREEQKTLTEQKERDIEYYKEKLEENEKEKAVLISDKEKHLRKIEYLEKEITEREKTINEMRERLNKLSEDDIIDPEFKRKIRVVREMEKDILNRLSEEENLYQKNLDDLGQRIAEKKKIIDDIRANLERLDRNYQSGSDKSSMARDQYERQKGKSLIEFQLQRESLSDLEDDYKRAEKKFEDFNEAKKSELNKVKVKEAEIVEYYLNRLRKEISESEGFRSLREALQEREDLKLQLEELKANPTTGEEYSQPDDFDDDAIGSELKAERKDQIIQHIDKLEEEIRSETLTYNQYHQKMTDLRIELEKRVEYEKQLRSKEEDVANFYSHKLSLNECQKQLQTIIDQLDEKKSNLTRLSEDPLLRTEYLRQKAEISDLEVHKSDTEVKIDYYNKAIGELEGKPIIDTYMKLVNQINQIRDASKEIREKAEEAKQSIQQKSQRLEQLKEKLSRYESSY